MLASGARRRCWYVCESLAVCLPVSFCQSHSLHVPSQGGTDFTAPILVFREDLSATFVISAFSNFMAANHAFDSNTGYLSWGVMGRVTSIPENYILSTIMSFSTGGIRNTMMSWGDALLTTYGKSRASHDFDLTLNYLGYRCAPIARDTKT
jgi:hypothetical protein